MNKLNREDKLLEPYWWDYAKNGLYISDNDFINNKPVDLNLQSEAIERIDKKFSEREIHIQQKRRVR